MSSSDAPCTISLETVIADFVVNSIIERDTLLNQAVAAAKAIADVEGRHGILVTRTDFQRFSVSLNPKVPFGYTHELDMTTR